MLKATLGWLITIGVCIFLALADLVLSLAHEFFDTGMYWLVPRVPQWVTAVLLAAAVVAGVYYFFWRALPAYRVNREKRRRRQDFHFD